MKIYKAYMNRIARLMDNDIIEKIHGVIAPCSNEGLVWGYLWYLMETSPDEWYKFETIIYNKYGLDMGLIRDEINDDEARNVFLAVVNLIERETDAIPFS